MKNLLQSIEIIQLFFSSMIVVNKYQTTCQKMDKTLPTLNALKKYWLERVGSGEV
jgi:hypothetical protein